MIRKDTCEACGRENVICNVQTVLDENGIATVSICDDEDDCYEHWD